VPGIAAGYEMPPSDVRAGELPVSRQLVPALAVDRAAGRAYVVSAAAPAVTEVDLATGARAVHDLAPRPTLARRLRDLLDPVAHAKLVEGATRQALLLGGGRLAVTGTDEAAQGERQRSTPHGLRIVDLRSWTVATADRRVAYVHPAAGTLLAAGTGARSGVRAFGLDGGRRWTALAGRPVDPVASGPRVYAREYRGRNRTHVLDLRTGRTLAVLSTNDLPVLVPPPPSP